MKWGIPIFAVLIVSSVPAFGSGLTLAPEGSWVETADPGGTVTFSGTLVDTDMDGSFLYLNDFSAEIYDYDAVVLTSNAPAGDSFFSTDPSVFYNVYGDLIGDGVTLDDTYPAGPIFDIDIAPGTPAGEYLGSVNILGGYDGPFVDYNPLLPASVNFEIVVAPEPGAWGLMLAGLAGVAAVRRWRPAVS